jgi:hypothetical protein
LALLFGTHRIGLFDSGCRRTAGPFLQFLDPLLGGFELLLGLLELGLRRVELGLRRVELGLRLVKLSQGVRQRRKESRDIEPPFPNVACELFGGRHTRRCRWNRTAGNSERAGEILSPPNQKGRGRRRKWTATPDALQGFGNWWHYLSGTWLIATDRTADEIFARLEPFIDDQLYILIAELGTDFSGWLPRDAWDWIRDRRTEGIENGHLAKAKGA